MTFTPAIDPDIEYPDSDGKPMADNTEQYEWIVKIKENLEILFANSPNVFIAGYLLWYPVQDKKITGPVAPDVMVVFGRPKGRRGSYKQWQEDNIAPQVVFEILSPEILEMPRLGCINVHGSILPKYRGSSPRAVVQFDYDKEAPREWYYFFTSKEARAIYLKNW